MKIESTLRVLAQLYFFTGGLCAATSNSSTISALLSDGNGKNSIYCEDSDHVLQNTMLTYSQSNWAMPRPPTKRPRPL